ncbi:hypothetical protein N0V85_001532 [Neurospora sp. IMI 360204]|nr:hypothetical protein N0V85_001532 [Neurospora sp. IMI 360204]
MAISLPNSHQPKDRPEPRDGVISPEPSSDHETHHDLNGKTHVAPDSSASSPSKPPNPITPSASSPTTIRTLFTTFPSLPLTNPLWHLIEHLYRLPNPPPPRVRDPSRPMRIICVGFPRTGTESLAQALSHLGYSHVYHAWDIVYDPSHLCYSPGWVRLARKKFYPVPGNHLAQSVITRADFEELLGHCQAVTDAPASVFAAELIAAYPEAKVVLNMRRDEEEWQESLVKTIIKANEKHCNMIRGLVPPSKLLEWYIEDGWEPLCKFLGKEMLDIPFPHANAAVGGWKAREEKCNTQWVERAFMNLLLIVTMFVFLIIA